MLEIMSNDGDGKRWREPLTVAFCVLCLPLFHVIIFLSLGTLAAFVAFLHGFFLPRARALLLGELV